MTSSPADISRKSAETILASSNDWIQVSSICWSALSCSGSLGNHDRLGDIFKGGAVDMCADNLRMTGFAHV